MQPGPLHRSEVRFEAGDAATIAPDGEPKPVHAGGIDAAVDRFARPARTRGCQEIPYGAGL